MNYRVIIGGNFRNKGAQSMLYCTVDILKKKYPLDEVVLVDLFPIKNSREKDKYAFKIVNAHIRSVVRIFIPFVKLFYPVKPISDPEKKISFYLNNACAIYDISGYSIRSNKQSLISTLQILLLLRHAGKRKIPYFMLPQSFGPINYKGLKKLFIWPKVKKYFKVPEKVFLREEKSYNEFLKIRRNNVFKSMDIVLLHNTIKKENIFAQANFKQYKTDIKFTPNTVLLIPNVRLYNFKSEEFVEDVYSVCIRTLLSLNKHVCLLMYSVEDKEMCLKLYEKFSSLDISIIIDDLDPFDLKNIFSSIGKVVSARYHGVVYALKAHKPVLTIGWANKYNDLMSKFGLNEYLIDLRFDVDLKSVEKKIKLLNSNSNIFEPIITSTLTKEIKRSFFVNET